MYNWAVIDKKLTKEFSFKNFVEAVQFLNVVATIAEARKHYPEILLHSYNKVKITLFTTVVDSITEKDRDFAEAVDNISKQLYL